MNPDDTMRLEIPSPANSNARKKSIVYKVTPEAYHLRGNPGLRGSAERLRRRSYIQRKSAFSPVSNMNVSFRSFRDSILSKRDSILSKRDSILSKRDIIKVDLPASLGVIDIKYVEDLESLGEPTMREPLENDRPMMTVKSPQSR
jgi:hypothetical protein